MPTNTLGRVERVPLVSTGTYKLSTGEHTFTEDDLKAAVAALNDPAVKAPRIKLGHIDPREGFDGPELDGEPSLGWVENMVLSDDGQTLYGDFVVPEWLAASMEYAYPSRSIEGTPPGWVSATGRTHDLVITAVSLLGVELPGVATLADLKDLLSEQGPAPITAATAVLASAGPKIRAGIDQEMIRRRYVELLDSGDLTIPDGTQPWSMWPRSQHFDAAGKPYLLVADEENGRLYRVDFKVKGNDVSYSDPFEVVEEHVAAGDGRRNRPPLAVWAKADSRPDEPNPKEESDMDPKQLRESIGLAEDASDDDVTARLAELNARPESAPSEQEIDERVAEAVAAARTDEREKIAASGGKVVDEARLAQMEADAKAGREARQEQVKAARAAFVETAVKAGKFPPARREHYLALMDRDEDGTREFIDSLEAGAIPTELRGNATSTDENTDQGEGTGWFTSTQKED